MSSELKHRLSVIINELTTTGALALPEATLADLKSLCKNRDDNVRVVFGLLLAQLRKNHAQVRYSAVQVADELFRRSRVFRELLVDQFDHFLEFAVGIKGRPLPPPAAAAEKLQRLAIEVVEGWHAAFGSAYVKLALGHDFLKNCDTNPTGPVSIARIVKDVEFKKEKEKERLERAQQKYERVLEQVRDYEGELRELLTRMDNAFCVLMPDPRTHELTFYLDQSLDRRGEVGVAPTQNAGNVVVFETLRECKRLLDRRYEKLLRIWINILSRGDHRPGSKAEDEATVARLAHLKKVVDDLLERCKAVGLDAGVPAEGASLPGETPTRPDADEFEEVQGEDAELEDVPAGFLDDAEREDGQDSSPAAPESPHAETPAAATVSSREATEDVSSLSREEQLRRAPVVPYGPDLEHWGKKSSLKVTSNADFIESYWFRSRDLDELPDPIVDVTAKRKVPLAQPERGPIRACRAPLRDGRLCERRDLETCPFHGPVIDRNEEGVPVDDAGRPIPNHFPERAFQRDRKKRLEGESPTKGGRKRKAPQLFNEELLSQWQDWEEDNPAEDPEEERRKAREAEKEERERAHIPGLEPLHKRPSAGAARLKAALNERSARKQMVLALDSEAERARVDLMENQWRPF